MKARYGLPVMKALSVRDAADLEAIEPYRGVADRFLFDAKPPAGSELPGGNGVSFDWRLLAGLDAERRLHAFRRPQRRPISARRCVSAEPAGIDVSSGVESAPGVKDAGADRGVFPGGAAARPARGLNGDCCFCPEA